MYMQLFHALARIFRSESSTYELHDTTLRDVVAIHGLLFPLPPLESEDVQVKITQRYLNCLWFVRREYWEWCGS